MGATGSCHVRDRHYHEPMTDSRPPRPIPALVLLFATVACNPAPPPSNPSTASAPPAPPSATPASTPAAGQTDTDWGRIWDSIPGGFPVYPGAAPAEDMTTDVVSASYAVSGADPQAIVDVMQERLEGASFVTDGRNGPLEDRSFVLDSSSADGCRIQVRAVPMGGIVNLTVRYGAGCPAP